MSNGRTLPSCVFPPRDPVKPNLNEKRRTPSDEEREEQKKPPTDESFIAKENETKKTNNTCSNRAGTGERVGRRPSAPPLPRPAPSLLRARHVTNGFGRSGNENARIAAKENCSFFVGPTRKTKQKKN